LKATQRAFVALGVFLALIVGLLIWNIQYNRAKAAETERKILSKLSADDVKMLVESQAQGNPQILAGIKEDPAQRKEILENLRGLLAQAAAARRSGIADDPDVKSQLDFQEKFNIASLYETKRNQEENQGKPAPLFSGVTPEQVEAFWKNPVHETEFNRIIEGETARMKAAGQTPPPLEGKLLERTREQFAKLIITYDKAKADEAFMNDRKTQLQVSLQQALLLAREYSTKILAKEVEPTKEEIAKFIAEHPEYDAAKQREKAEQILQQVKAGGDFASLAKQYSDDPGSKEKGGLYENITQGQFVPEFEQAVAATDKGQVVPNLVESQFGYHIIKVEDKKTENKDGKETMVFSARHILINTKFPLSDNNPLARPQLLSGEEIAKAKIGEEKQKKAIEELIKNNKIELPEDFTVDITDVPQGNVPLPNDGELKQKKAPSPPKRKS
jgi:parvulin-like peptidyl-prolyl isomerase